MRRLIARVFDYSLDGVIATEGTEFFQFCRDLPEDPVENARLDLIDQYRVTLVPYLADEGPRLFEDTGKSRQLDLLSSTAFSSGLQLDYRRRRTGL